VHESEEEDEENQVANIDIESEGSKLEKSRKAKVHWKWVAEKVKSKQWRMQDYYLEQQV